jgi:hypothetical protein
MSAPQPRSRRLWLAGLVTVVVLGVAAVCLVAVSGSRSGGPARSAGSSPTVETPPADPGRTVALPSSAPTAVPSAVLAAAPGFPTRLTPVALSAPTSYGDGLSARVAGIRSFTARGEGVGEFSGPALAITVELRNTSAVPVSLATTSVAAYGGARGARTTALTDGATAPFSGTLAPGATARATYTFAVPTDQRDVVTVTVGVSPATGTAVFSGPVS